METKNITIRIPVDMYQDMQQKSENVVNAGSISQQIVDRLRKEDAILKYSTDELRGKFTVPEWCAIADMLNGTITDGEFRFFTGALVAEVEDSDRYEGLCAKWEIDRDTLIGKCKQLTAAQLDALYSRVEKFWLHAANTDLKEWAKF